LSGYINDYAPGVIVPSNYKGAAPMKMEHPADVWNRTKQFAHHAALPAADSAHYFDPHVDHYGTPVHSFDRYHTGHYATPVVEYTSIHHEPSAPQVAKHEHLAHTGH